MHALDSKINSYNNLLWWIFFLSFRFDALSHRSSGNSLNVSENMGVVSKTSTPLSGSLENLGGGELLRKNFGGANSTSSQRCVLKSFRSMTNSLTDCVVFSSPYF